MARDAKQPSPQGGCATEAVQVLPSRDEDLLNEIVDEIVPWRQPATDKRIDRIGIGVYEFRSGLAIPLQDSGYKCNVVVDTMTGLSGRERNATQIRPTLCIDASMEVKYSFRRERLKVTRDHGLAF